jgi:hypothetical protein
VPSPITIAPKHHHRTPFACAAHVVLVISSVTERERPCTSCAPHTQSCTELRQLDATPSQPMQAKVTLSRAESYRVAACRCIIVPPVSHTLKGFLSCERTRSFLRDTHISTLRGCIAHTLGGPLMFTVIRPALTPHAVLIYVVYANTMTRPAADAATLRATAVACVACSLCIHFIVVSPLDNSISGTQASTHESKACSAQPSLTASIGQPHTVERVSLCEECA